MFNHHGYLSNFVKINIYTSKYNLCCTTTMASPNEDSLHAHEPNANPTYTSLKPLTKRQKSKCHLWTFPAPKEGRRYEAAITALHYITPIHQIKRELQLYGYTILHVSNIISKRTTQAFSMFSIELESAKNNTEIFNIPRLLHTIIQIELPSHTNNYWNKGYKCIKCAKQQLSKNCVNRLDKLTCSNCKEAHPTNYRDYKLREELIAKITRQRPKTWLQKQTNN